MYGHRIFWTRRHICNCHLITKALAKPFTIPVIAFTGVILVKKIKSWTFLPGVKGAALLDKHLFFFVTVMLWRNVCPIRRGKRKHFLLKRSAQWMMGKILSIWSNTLYKLSLVLHTLYKNCLCTTFIYVQHLFMYNIYLCTAFIYVQHLFMYSIYFCTAFIYVQHLFMYNIQQAW